MGLAVALGAGQLGCARSRAEEARWLPVTGTVVAAPEGGTVRIAHEDIPGYMPAMTMPFAVSAEDAKALRVGDRVQFLLRPESSGLWMESVTVIGRDDRPEARLTSANGRVSRLHEGDVLPPFSLVDQAGAPLTDRDLRGHPTLVTFIFTRCPVPEFCPLMSRRFKQVQERLDARGGAPAVRLLSVTLDPEFDTPPVLAAYARSLGADVARWRFAGGDPDAVLGLARAFSIYTERNGALLDHTLATALVDDDGRVVRIWRGNGWTVDEVLGAIDDVASQR